MLPHLSVPVIDEKGAVGNPEGDVREERNYFLPPKL